VSETDLSNPPQNNRKGPWLWIAVVAAITLVLILLVPGEEQSETPNTSTASPVTPPSLLTSDRDAEPRSTQPIEEGAAASTEQAPEPAKTEAQVDLAPGAAARNLIADLRQTSPLNLDRAFAEAETHQQAGRDEDAYLLFFFAAREGHAESAMTLAQQSDPASFQPGGLFDEADELQAYKWYSSAAESGHPDASDHLQRLRSQVENAANNGDQRAQRIMLQWN